MRARVLGELLSARDEELHVPGPEENWSESRYADFLDPETGLAGWFRLGNRVNQGHAELSACLHLPDGTAAVMFSRPRITGNDAAAGGLSWEVIRPFEEITLRYAGDMIMLADPRSLTDPKVSFTLGQREPAEVSLTIRGGGLAATLGFDQDHVGRIFLAGQAHGHYQLLARTSGLVSVGQRRWAVSGLGGRDHSWGPRDWQAKNFMRWLVGAADEDFGFMVTRTSGPGREKRGGFVWDDGIFHWVDGLRLDTEYAGPEGYPVRTRAVLRSGAHAWRITGTALTHLPLRHRGTGPDGGATLLRIIKAPARWTVLGRGPAYGITEYHDVMTDGRSAGYPE